MRIVFKQPSNPQTSSRLVQLPAEIRLKIYRLLHKNDKPLYSEEEIEEVLNDNGPNADEEYFATSDHSLLSYQSNVSLSSQLLATCQQVYLEGQAILYATNVLSICCNIRGSYIDCSILNMMVTLPVDIGDLPRENFDLFDLAIGRNDMDSILMYSTLERFQTFRLVLFISWNSSAEPIAVCCRVLQNLLLEKHVTIVPLGYLVWELRSNNYRLLSTLRYLRCSTISLNASDAGIIDVDDEIFSVIQANSSQAPFRDTVDTFLSVVSMVKKYCGDNYEYYCESMLNKLAEAAVTYDVNEFEDAMMQVSGELKSLKQEWMNREVEKSSRKKASMGQKVGAYMATKSV